MYCFLKTVQGVKHLTTPSDLRWNEADAALSEVYLQVKQEPVIRKYVVVYDKTRRPARTGAAWFTI